ncbi:MAG: family 43 glycosylhydrolase [Lachnospiraceae bacterium]|nr:family 43 glycosylhydrolase [Lachnospiraceae bacterium]
MKYFCNPLNVNYRYQFNKDQRNGGAIKICREAADPSMILYKGRYYIFASMTLGVWVSDDLASWENHRLPDALPLYDYAPDVRVLGDWVYFCASRRGQKCDRYRTKDVLNGPYEKIKGTFDYWDPNLFLDDDGRVYFYWGCTNTDPIWGVELDPETMKPLGEKIGLIEGHPFEIGYERVGEDNASLPASEEEVDQAYKAFVKRQGIPEFLLPKKFRPLIKGMFSRKPYIEGAWMTKHDGRYYLQYAAPGTQYNTYADGVYVSDKPLGPFTLAENNPFSYKPGGFFPGAGHGSTMEDKEGAWWHTATMRISVNHDFERRVGPWPAGFDRDGELFTNQRYGDWPMDVESLRRDPWADPAWMLLSAGKAVSCSSFTEGHEPERAAEENVQSFWQAGTSEKDEWLMLDLGYPCTVNAVQINFADAHIDVPVPGKIRPGTQARYIEEAELHTRWKLECSENGRDWEVLEDKTAADTDLSHDLVVREEGITARYLRLSQMEVPYLQQPCISGFRVFGRGEGFAPAVPQFTAVRSGDLDMTVTIEAQPDTTGFNVLFGSAPDKLYHSYMLFSAGDQRIGALIKGRAYYVRVDAFNDTGITEGKTIRLNES